MSLEKGVDLTMIGYLLAPIFMILGLNMRWSWLLHKKIGECPERYVSTKAFNHRVDRLEDSVKAEINGLYEHINKLAERRYKER